MGNDGNVRGALILRTTEAVTTWLFPKLQTVEAAPDSKALGSWLVSFLSESGECSAVLLFPSCFVAVALSFSSLR